MRQEEALRRMNARIGPVFKRAWERLALDIALAEAIFSAP